MIACGALCHPFGFHPGWICWYNYVTPSGLGIPMHSVYMLGELAINLTLIDSLSNGMFKKLAMLFMIIAKR